MKWLHAACSFLLVALGVFFIAGWCSLPDPKFPPREVSRVDRLRAVAQMDWSRNWWGYLLAPSLGGLSAWLTIRKADRKSAS